MNRTSGKLLVFGAYSRFIGEISLRVTGGGLAGPKKDIKEHSCLQWKDSGVKFTFLGCVTRLKWALKKVENPQRFIWAS